MIQPKLVEAADNGIAMVGDRFSGEAETVELDPDEDEMDIPRRASDASSSWKDNLGAAKTETVEKLRTSVEYVKEKGGLSLSYVNEKRQQGVAYVKEKQEKASEFVKEKGGIGVDFVKEKGGISVDFVKDKGGQGVDFVKEKGKVVKEKVGEVKEKVGSGVKQAWANGRGQLQRVKNKIQEGEWSGSANKTLGVEEREGLWKDIKVKGAQEITIPARKEHTTAYLVQKGTLLRWTFRVKERDLGFGVRMRVMQDGGSIEETVLPLEKFDDQETISGSWMADIDRTMILVFDNTYSKVRTKTIAYIVGIETLPSHVDYKGEKDVKMNRCQDEQVENDNETKNVNQTDALSDGKNSVAALKAPSPFLVPLPLPPSDGPKDVPAM